MTWQAAIFAGLAIVLAAGFAWFERSRPSSRVIALVAALAALAVAGRLVLSPLPNVVATTDIAFITGFALGAAPGFAVGALAAPISNIWLGQGPWTAWEMAGWGMAGLAGAAFAALAGRDSRRLVLACACAAVGLLYGALLDLSVMVTYGGEQSLDRYLALSARGIPFNVAHALGNFAIALAAGPALVRMISRYRERLEFRWHPAGALGVALAALVLAMGASLTQPAPAEAAGKAQLRYLVANQNSDGGFAATPGLDSSPGMTTWTMLALEAAGRNPLDVRENGKTPVDYLRATVGGITSATELQRTIIALEGAGISSRSFAGHNLVSALRDKRSGDASWQGQVNITAFGILALRAAGEDDVERSADWLRDAQSDGGGWGFRPGAPGDADSTGAALQALAVAGGGSGKAIARGARFLRSSQRSDGAWSLAGGVSNSQSTAWAVQGLVAVGKGRDARRGGIDYLHRRVAEDGHVRYSESSDQTPVWVTGQALMALRKEALPIAPVARAPQRANGAGDETGTGSQGSGTGANAGLPGNFGNAPAQGGRPDGFAPGGGRTAQGPAGPGADQEAAAEDDSGVLGESGESSPIAAAATAAEPQDDSSTALYLGIGFGALALALAGGFFWYRRTLP